MHMLTRYDPPASGRALTYGALQPVRCVERRPTLRHSPIKAIEILKCYDRLLYIDTVSTSLTARELCVRVSDFIPQVTQQQEVTRGKKYGEKYTEQRLPSSEIVNEDLRHTQSCVLLSI